MTAKEKKAFELIESHKLDCQCELCMEFVNSDNAEEWKTKIASQNAAESLPAENGVSKFFGTWPGGETDGELLGALDEVRKPVAEPKPTPSASTEDEDKTGQALELFISERERVAVEWGIDPKGVITERMIQGIDAEVNQRLRIRLVELLGKPQPDSSSIPDIELELRRMMWLGHGHTGMYGDDGEMQCGECHPFGVVDYKREPLDKVRETFRAVQMERMMKPRDSSSISSEQELAWLESRWKSALVEGKDDYSNALIVAIEALKSYAAKRPADLVKP